MSNDADTATDILLLRLGEVVRQRRHALGLTLKDVSAASGLSHPFLSKIERGLARPSMRSLTALAEALGTSAPKLLVSDTDTSVPRANGATGSVELVHEGGALCALPHGPKSFVPIEFRSGPREFGSYCDHSGADFIYVCEGQVELDLEGYGLHVMGPGDSVFYGAGVAHRWRVVSEGAVRILLVQQADPVSDTRAPEYLDVLTPAS